jgi:hypothetical protein
MGRGDVGGRPGGGGDDDGFVVGASGGEIGGSLEGICGRGTAGDGGASVEGVGGPGTGGDIGASVQSGEVAAALGNEADLDGGERDGFTDGVREPPTGRNIPVPSEARCISYSSASTH